MVKLEVPVGPELVGRVVDALEIPSTVKGQPIVKAFVIEKVAPGVMTENL